MPLSAGDKLGPYEILAPLGAGGMGEVYRARDNKLEREVAIKVLSESLAPDPERLADSNAKPRFSRRSITPTSRRFTASRIVRWLWSWCRANLLKDRFRSRPL